MYLCIFSKNLIYSSEHAAFIHFQWKIQKCHFCDYYASAGKELNVHIFFIWIRLYQAIIHQYFPVIYSWIKNRFRFFSRKIPNTQITEFIGNNSRPNDNKLILKSTLQWICEYNIRIFDWFQCCSYLKQIDEEMYMSFIIFSTLFEGCFEMFLKE